jgi:uncharacterized protein YecT (DUF1311 family)
LILLLAACGRKPEAWLQKAEASYQAGEKEKAKEAYLKAAELGSAEAHFAIAYRFNVTEEESIFHYSEAAKLGHGEALGYALDALLFRANSLFLADPQKALELYERAKKKNPSLDLYDEEAKLEVMKKCVEAGPFDAEEFIRRYQLEEGTNTHGGYYQVWEWAEEASKGGRFGKPDPHLVFQLIARGGCVPAELELAVNEFYDYWKNGVVKEFNICRYVTSGLGQGYCSDRALNKTDQEHQTELRSIVDSVGENAKKLAEPAFLAAEEFITEKAWNEEGHGGSGVRAWVQTSIIDQKAEFLSTLKKIRDGFVPQEVKDLALSDKDLNETYSSILKKLAAHPIEGVNVLRVDPESVRNVQRLWIPYRDRSSALYARLSPARSEDFWKSWLTQVRIDQLKKILELD